MIKNTATIIFGAAIAILVATALWLGWYRIMDEVIDWSTEAGAAESGEVFSPLASASFGTEPIARPASTHRNPVPLERLGWDVTYLTPVEAQVRIHLNETLIELDEHIIPDIHIDDIVVFDNENQDPYLIAPNVWTYDVTNCLACTYTYADIAGLANMDTGDVLIDDTALYGYHGVVVHELAHQVHAWIYANDLWAASRITDAYAQIPASLADLYAGTNEAEAFAEVAAAWLGCTNVENDGTDLVAEWPAMANIVASFFANTHITHC